MTPEPAMTPRDVAALSGTRSWTITTSYTVDDRSTGGSWYVVGATIRGPEQREPVEVVPADSYRAAVARAEAAERRVEELLEAEDSGRICGPRNRGRDAPTSGPTAAGIEVLMQRENTSRTPMQIARQALKEAKAEGLVREFSVRKAGRATVYPAADGGKFYTEHVLDTLALIDRLRKERDDA